MRATDRAGKSDSIKRRRRGKHTVRFSLFIGFVHKNIASFILSCGKNTLQLYRQSTYVSNVSKHKKKSSLCVLFVHYDSTRCTLKVSSCCIRLSDFLAAHSMYNLDVSLCNGAS